MSGINKVILVGRLGKDPEVKHLENGTAVANFSIATSESYKNKAGEKVENVEWHNVVLWKNLAEIAGKYAKKGQLVYIEGKLTTRSWEKDGITKYTTEVVGSNLQLLGGSGNNSNQEPVTADTSNVDDLPF